MYSCLGLAYNRLGWTGVD